jgi:hypothetical protein
MSISKMDLYISKLSQLFETLIDCKAQMKTEEDHNAVSSFEVGSTSSSQVFAIH